MSKKAFILTLLLLNFVGLVASDAKDKEDTKKGGRAIELTISSAPALAGAAVVSTIKTPSMSIPACFARLSPIPAIADSSSMSPVSNDPFHPSNWNKYGQ